jgi:hypothetical protein
MGFLSLLENPTSYLYGRRGYNVAYVASARGTDTAQVPTE